MSDYGDYAQYEEAEGEYQYDQDAPMQVEEDFQTKVDLQFFEAQQLLRKNQTDKCIESLQGLYKISQEHNLKNWKVKILNLLLQIHCQAKNSVKIKETLQKISELNNKQKYTQNAIKSIIMTIKSLPQPSFQVNKSLVYGFLDQLDTIGKVRSYILFLQKAVQDKNNKQAEKLFQIVNQLILECIEVPAGNLIQLYSLQIRHSKNCNQNITDKIRKMDLRISSLQSEAYMSEGHIAIIKQAIAEILYLQNNFQDCATYLCESFQQNMKYGKNNGIKDLLKINVLIVLLTNNSQLCISDKINSLYHESASSFKSQSDIQALYGVIEAYNSCDLAKFKLQTDLIGLKGVYPYENLVKKAILQLKKNKTLQIIKPYSKIKLSYLQRRLNSTSEEIKQILFDLITSNLINGRMRFQQKESYLDIYPKKDQFLSVQLQNIKELSKRYL